MKKSKSQTSRSQDLISLVLLVVITIFSLVQLFHLSFPSPQITRLSLAAGSLLASFLYFQRVRGLVNSTSTPISDTLVVLGGIYLALALITPVVSDLSLAIIWSVVILGVGILGRLILLDSVILSLLDSLHAMIVSMVSWVRLSVLNGIRAILALLGLLLVIPLFQIPSFQYLPLLGYLLLSLSVALGIRRQHTPHLFFRVSAILLGLVLGINLMMGGLEITVVVGRLLLLVTLLLWVLGSATLVRLLEAIKRTLPWVFRSFRFAVHFIVDFFRDNKLLLLRLVLFFPGLILLLMGLFEPSSTYLLIGTLLLALSVADKLYYFIRDLLSWLYRSLKVVWQYVVENPQFSIQMAALVAVPFALFLLPSEHSINWIAAIILVLIAIGPTVFQPLYQWLTATFRSLLRSIREHPIGSVQVVLVISSIFALFLVPRQGSLNRIVALILLVAGLAPSILTPIYNSLRSFVSYVISSFKEHPVGSLQVVSLLASLPALIFLPRQGSLNRIVALLLVVAGIAPSILSPVYRFLSSTVRSIIRNFREHPVGSLQVLLLIAAIPAFIFLPRTPLVGSYSQRQVGALSLLILGILPSVVSWFARLLPGIRAMLSDLAHFVGRLAQNREVYLLAMSGIGLYLLFKIPPQNLFLRLGVALLTAFSLSLLGNNFVMRLYDGLTLALLRFVTAIGTFLKALLPRIALGSVQSFLSWVLLIMGITGWFFPTALLLGGWGRIICIFLSIFLWNTAYPHRRKRFFDFLNRFTAGLVRRLISLVDWIFRNLLILVLIVLGFVFFIIAFGLVFPGSISFVVSIFGDVLTNRLVSWIIAGFLGAMGVFTIQQSYTRRQDLQITGGKSQ